MQKRLEQMIVKADAKAEVTVAMLKRRTRCLGVVASARQQYTIPFRARAAATSFANKRDICRSHATRV